jgi:hypothetical protein
VFVPGAHSCHPKASEAAPLIRLIDHPLLEQNMLVGRPDAAQRAATIVEHLIDLSRNKGHDKHIHFKECEELGLEIRSLEDPKDKKLQDLVLTVHHCYMFSLSNTPAFKFIENHTGRRWIKAQLVQQQIIFPQPMMPGSVPQPQPAQGEN